MRRLQTKALAGWTGSRRGHWAGSSGTRKFALASWTLSRGDWSSRAEVVEQPVSP